MSKSDSLQVLQTWPAAIFLVAGDKPLLPFNDLTEVTWCSDRVGEADVVYHRDDLVEQKLEALHRSVASAVQHGSAGWARYEEANKDRNAVCQERVQLVTRIAELEHQLDVHEGAAADAATRQTERAQ